MLLRLGEIDVHELTCFVPCNIDRHLIDSWSVWNPLWVLVQKVLKPISHNPHSHLKRNIWLPVLISKHDDLMNFSYQLPLLKDNKETRTGINDDMFKCNLIWLQEKHARKFLFGASLSWHLIIKNKTCSLHFKSRDALFALISYLWGKMKNKVGWRSVWRS